MAIPTVASHMISALAEAGVRNIYGVVGDSLNSLGTRQKLREFSVIEWDSSCTNQ